MRLVMGRVAEHLFDVIIADVEHFDLLGLSSVRT